MGGWFGSTLSLPPADSAAHGRGPQTGLDPMVFPTQRTHTLRHSSRVSGRDRAASGKRRIRRRLVSGVVVMTDRLDRTILEFVDTGQITPEVAQELSRELHHPPIDVKQRLAELAGYVGAGLAVLGVVVIASQVWSDFGQVLQALVPAVLSAGLLLGTYLVVHAVPHISEHPVRGRIAQVMGVASAVFALLATAVAFDPAPGETFRWQMFLAVARRSGRDTRGGALVARLHRQRGGGHSAVLRRAVLHRRAGYLGRGGVRYRLLALDARPGRDRRAGPAPLLATRVADARWLASACG